LIAFVAVAVCMMVLRVRAPLQPRVFTAPLWWITGPLAIVGCIYLFLSLPLVTLQYCLIWTVVGLIVYFLYARRASALATQ
jgi:APA family basic amino acid/polyamine antiporter